MRWFSALLLLFLAGGIYLAIHFVQQSPRSVISTVNASPYLPPNINLRLTRLSVIGRKDGRRAWEIEAEQMDTTRDHNELDFAGKINAKFLQDGNVRATVLARSAHYSNLQKILTASGPIVCTIKPEKPTGDTEGDDLHIESDKVIWNVGARQLQCPGKVHATKGSYSVDGMEAAVDMKNRNLTMRNVAATIPVEDAEGLLPEKTIP